MSLIEELIKLNKRTAAGPAAGSVKRSVRQRWWLRLDVLDEKVRKHREKAARRVLKAHRRERELRLAAIRRKIRREARGWDGRYGIVPGTAQTESQWVRVLAHMEPGRWYGSSVLAAELDVPRPFYRGCKWASRLFVDKGKNPRGGLYRNWVRGEATYVWRLNKWGEALREAVKANPEQKLIEIMKLPGANPSAWAKARAKQYQYRKSRNRPVAESTAI